MVVFLGPRNKTKHQHHQKTQPNTSNTEDYNVRLLQLARDTLGGTHDNIVSDESQVDQLFYGRLVICYCF